MLHTLLFPLQNVVYFIMLPFFGSGIIQILYTGVLKFKRKFRRQRVNNSAVWARPHLYILSNGLNERTSKIKTGSR